MLPVLLLKLKALIAALLYMLCFILSESFQNLLLVFSVLAVYQCYDLVWSTCIH